MPDTKELRAKENAIQRKLIGILQGTRLITGEDVPAFLDRRRRLATAVAQKRGLWGQRHIDRCLAWREHLFRERNEASWPATLIKLEDELYLEGNSLLLVVQGLTSRPCMSGSRSPSWSGWGI